VKGGVKREKFKREGRSTERPAANKTPHSSLPTFIFAWGVSGRLAAYGVKSFGVLGRGRRHPCRFRKLRFLAVALGRHPCRRRRVVRNPKTPQFMRQGWSEGGTRKSTRNVERVPEKR
jgi:hypothetical protein